MHNFSSWNSIPNLIGLVGVFFILLCYFMSQAEWWKHDDYAYLFGNFFGSVCLIISLLYNWNVSSFIIEIVWILITIYGFVKRTLKNSRKISNISTSS